MSYTPHVGEKLTFCELLRKGYKIRIPSIQREYTYGNTTPKTAEKRQKFLHFIFEALTGNKEKSLGFIYGNISGGYLEPLDGQQRLTTLFLLYWLLAEGTPNLLCASDQAAFSYATRPTTQAFCNVFCRQNARTLIEEWRKKPKSTFSDFLQNNDWFQYQWRQDPSIKSMLNMLNDMIAYQDQLSAAPLTPKDLDRLTFYFLELEGIAGEDIYVKMNARGKQLSEFDLYKSGLEEKIQRSFDGRPADKARFEHAWRQSVDGDWLQFFWQNYGPEKDPQKSGVPDYTEFDAVEAKYLLFWKRLTNLYSLYCQQSDTEYLERLQKDSNALFYADANNKMTDVSEYLKDITFDFKNKGLSLLELMIGQKPCSQKEKKGTQERNPDLPTQVIFLGMLLFAQKFEKELHANQANTVKNFRQYMTVVRNISLNENREEELRNDVKTSSFCKELEKLANEFKIQYDKHNDWDFYTFLDTLSADKLKAGWNEEIWKAKLIKTDASLSPNSDLSWAQLFEEANNHEYVRGQTVAWLQWVMPNGALPKNVKENEDAKAKFADYFNRFKDLYALSQDNQGKYLLYSALLAFGDYKQQMPGNRYKLFTWNQSPDYSWKRALRSGETTVLKDFIDAWQSISTSQKNASEFCRGIKGNANLQGWRKWLVLSPQALDYSANNLLQKGNDDRFFILSKKRSNSAQYEVFLAALAQKMKQSNGSESFFEGKDRLVFIYQGKKHQIVAKPNGMYSWTIDEAEQTNAPRIPTSTDFTDEEIWNRF